MRLSGQQRGGPLEFKDEPACNDTLSALTGKRRPCHAGFYKPKERLFAHYSKLTTANPGVLTSHLQEKAMFIEGGYLEVFQEGGVTGANKKYTWNKERGT